MSISFSAVGAGKERRIRQFIKPDGRSLLVAVDHAAYMGQGPPLSVIGDIAKGGPDGVLATWHVARSSAVELAGSGLVLRVDGGMSELGAFPTADVSTLLASVDDALRVGADAVVVLAFPGTKDEEVSLQRLALLCAECEKVGLPVIAEALPGGFGQEIEWTFYTVARAARIAAELGADVVKTVCPGDPKEFGQVVSACPVPVVALGGPRVENEDDIVNFAKGIVDSGACGVAIGRNVWGSPDPAKLVTRLHEAIHG
jgi:class I fructose-bisphosphate aldolase/fructose-bisphosphate aldolase/2-amino-3,7-dideoxy-D-threo-hept-6-ulosonate synthase